MGKIISISGTHCTGKTTLIEALKKMPEYKDVCFLKSSGRQLYEKNPSLKINEDGDFRSQLYFMARDIEMILENASQPVVICDRSFIDTFVYSRYLFLKGKMSMAEFEVLKQMFVAVNSLVKFDKVYLLKPTFALKEEQNRSMSLDFQKEIYQMFDIMIIAGWEYLPDTLERRISTITNFIWKTK